MPSIAEALCSYSISVPIGNYRDGRNFQRELSTEPNKSGGVKIFDTLPLPHPCWMCPARNIHKSPENFGNLRVLNRVRNLALPSAVRAATKTCVWTSCLGKLPARACHSAVRGVLASRKVCGVQCKKILGNPQTAKSDL